MEVALILSQEHPTLPKAEVEAVLECEGITYSVVKDCGGLLLLSIPDKYLKNLTNISRRLSYTHEMIHIIINADENKLISEAKNCPWKKYVLSDYAVRVKKMDRKSSLKTSDLEWEMGSIIKKTLGKNAQVKLKDPSILIKIILQDGMAFVGYKIGQISKKHFYNLKPHKRPFFFPGSMSPKLARCMVNLTRVHTGETLLDPFCGTGGILIEAGLIGTMVIGTDIDYKMVEGTKENLQHCDIQDYHVFQEDARKLKLPKVVDAIVTDPPYGISASTGGESSENLYSQSMISLERLIKDDGLLCLATPHYLNLDEIFKGTKFKIIEQHHIRMHKSLTRVISVLKKI
ncbi:MAG: TIGR01177 family methyltransferase [Methanobacterium sp.]|jgi:tRNA (guanine10-N2)-dimethyltransferase|nr:TIGR01177 family methyltransferase [Methanobacterium sp.]